jgi:hypothetical protein
MSSLGSSLGSAKVASDQREHDQVHALTAHQADWSGHALPSEAGLESNALRGRVVKMRKEFQALKA